MEFLLKSLAPVLINYVNLFTEWHVLLKANRTHRRIVSKENKKMLGYILNLNYNLNLNYKIGVGDGEATFCTSFDFRFYP
jgi:hypothetical protein